MRTVRYVMILGTAATPALLAVLTFTGGLGIAGWAAGLATGWAVTALYAVARTRTDRPVAPADWVTLTRALLAAGVTGLVAGSFTRPQATVALVTVAAVALILDAADGKVARRTGTATTLGARFDGEIDAFLILVLSVEVSRQYGPWVLAIGAARYVFWAAGRIRPWLAAPLPPRYWRKVVAAIQGIVLTVAISGLLPSTAGVLAVVAALILLAESFGRDVVWLYRTGAGPRTRRVLRYALTAPAAVLLWVVLLVPDRPDRLAPAAFARIPIEGVLLVAAAALLPSRPRRILAIAAGFVFGLLTVVKIADLGAYTQIDRRFDPLLDLGELRPAMSVVRAAIGPVVGNAVPVVTALAAVLLIALAVLSAVRVASVAARHRRGTVYGAGAAAIAWAAAAALSLQLLPGMPLASADTAGPLAAHVRDTGRALHAEDRFAAALRAPDPYATVPAKSLLTGLRGADVLVVFVESYGRVAVHGTPFSAGVDDVLHTGTTTLARAGYQARSAYLTSPTFGGISWLAHSTLQSGLWVDSQRRYDRLVRTDRFTLAAAFGKAGWRTVADVPSNPGPWPQGRSFYHYAQTYGEFDTGYHGPAFSYAAMPDQYILAAFQHRELYAGHKPLMAEIDLVSSHAPWTPLPHLVPWNRLGDGTIFDSMPAAGLTPTAAWQNLTTVRDLYGRSIQYSLGAVVSWAARVPDPNLVLIVLGDHQPSTTVSGLTAGHQVPISVIARDPRVLARIAPWHWQPGLLPGPAAPDWPMNTFRDRFLTTFR